MKGIVLWFPLPLVVLFVASACDNGKESQGGLGQPCYPDDTCDGPLVCEDGECVAGGPYEKGDPVLLVEGGDAGGDGRWLLGVSADGDEPVEVGARFEWRPATISGPAHDIDSAPAAHDGFGAFAVKKMYQGQARLARGRIDDEPPQLVDLGDIEAVALHVAGDAVFVGAWGEVGWVDMKESVPEYERLVHRPDMEHKPYDLFARDCDRLLAIDDIILPILGDYFHLDERGKPTHLADWHLPGYQNGTYEHVLLVPDEGDDRVLYVAARFVSGYTGPGRVLSGHRVEGNSLGDDARQLREPLNDELIAGDEPTDFEGLAWYPGTESLEPALLVAAGERGLIVLPDMIDSEEPAYIVDVGGPCLDVAFAAGRVHALVGGDAPRVVRLSYEDGEWSTGAHLALDEPGSRFAR